MKLLETLLKNKFTLNVDKQLKFDDKKQNTSKKFLNFCCDELDLKKHFTCNIVNDKKENGIKTSAFYMPNEDLIVVYGKNRMLGDILRSIAHELVHHWQFENDMLEYPVQDVGGEIEDQANAKAGSLIKKFIKEDDLGGNLFESRKFL